MAAAPPPKAAASSGMGIGDFYNARRGAPLWFAPSSGNAAQALLDVLKSARADGLEPDRYGVDALDKALTAAWGGDRKAVQRADVMLSQAFALYVSDLRRQPELGIIYVDGQLRPGTPLPRGILEAAAKAPSLESYIRTLGWMNPLYGQLRQALVNHRFASLNPYWYVPPDLASERIAPNVLKRGMKYLDELGYEVMSDWTPNAAIIDPKTVDWKGVADGKVEVLMRQKPGPHNSMGRIKFMFPNSEGVYLHDNPERELFTEASRLYSGGCVRLEDAWRLSRWLFGRELTWEGAGTEEPVPLEPPVPVYITYLTAMPNGTSIAFFDDVYGRDKARLAQLQAGSGAVTTAAK
jgi:murein L,D-transpeptidase YcbB/YkuD